MNATSFVIMPSDLERYKEEERILLERENQYEKSILDYMNGLVKLRAKLKIIQNLIALEEDGPEIEDKQFELSLSSTNSSNEAVTVSKLLNNANLSLGSSGLAKEWYEYVERRLHDLGPTTVEALYGEMSKTWVDAFNSVDSVNSPMFRARRLLRRSPIFEVDRVSGLVTMTEGATPSMPSYTSNALVVDDVYRGAGKIRFVKLTWRGKQFDVDYFKFKSGISEGLEAWMRTSRGTVLPLAIKLMMSKQSVISSYDEEGWNTEWGNKYLVTTTT